MPSPWQLDVLGQHISLLSGQHIEATRCTSNSTHTPYLTGPADFPDGKIKVSKYTPLPKVMCRAGDVLVTVKGSGTGKIIVADADYCISRQLMAVRAESCRAEWLFHLLGSHVQHFREDALGLIPGITRRGLLELEVKVPPLTEQRLIAGILDTLDEAIRKTEQLIAKLKLVKQGLLHDLLTRGIDENGKLRDPERHPEQFKDSSLGRIPREWEVRPLNSLADNHDGHRIPLKQADRDRRKGPFPYYGASGIIDWIDGYIFDGEYVLLGEDGENVRSRELPLAFKVTGRFWVNNHAHIFSARRGVDTRFLTQLLEATDYSTLVSGSAQPKLTQRALSRFVFRVPAQPEQSAIADVLDSYSKHKNSESQSLAKLRLLKTGLMDDLLTGRVRVTPFLGAEP